VVAPLSLSLQSFFRHRLAVDITLPSPLPSPSRRHRRGHVVVALSSLPRRRFIIIAAVGVVVAIVAALAECLSSPLLLLPPPRLGVTQSACVGRRRQRLVARAARGCVGDVHRGVV